MVYGGTSSRVRRTGSRSPGSGGANRGRGYGTASGRESSVDDRRSVGDTVRRSGNLGLVRDGGDGAQRLRRLRVGLDLAGWIRINAGEVLVVALARLERPVLGAVGGIVGASNTVINVLAEVASVGASGVADLEAEEVSAKEAITGR